MCSTSQPVICCHHFICDSNEGPGENQSSAGLSTATADAYKFYPWPQVALTRKAFSRAAVHSCWGSRVPGGEGAGAVTDVTETSLRVDDMGGHFLEVELLASQHESSRAGTRTGAARLPSLLTPVLLISCHPFPAPPLQG